MVWTLEEWPILTVTIGSGEPAREFVRLPYHFPMRDGPMESAARRLSERVVLVVDDEDAVCRLVSRMLAEAGFHVLEAHSGADALALLSTLDGRVQLVLSDIAMPGMTGTELAAIMAGQYPQTPLILMSGQGEPTADYPGPFLPKPFSPDALLDAVGHLVRRTDQAGRV